MTEVVVVPTKEVSLTTEELKSIYKELGLDVESFLNLYIESRLNFDAPNIFVLLLQKIIEFDEVRLFLSRDPKKGINIILPKNKTGIYLEEGRNNTSTTDNKRELQPSNANHEFYGFAVKQAVNVVGVYVVGHSVNFIPNDLYGAHISKSQMYRVLGQWLIASGVIVKNMKGKTFIVSNDEKANMTLFKSLYGILIFVNHLNLQCYTDLLLEWRPKAKKPVGFYESLGVYDMPAEGSDMIEYTPDKRASPLFDVLVKIEPYVHYKFSQIWKNAWWFDTIRLKIFDIFERPFNAKEIVDKVKAKHDDQQRRGKIIQEVWDKKFKENMYRWMYIQKFGMDKFLKLTKDQKFYPETDLPHIGYNILELCPKKEADIVRLAVKNYSGEEPQVNVATKLLHKLNRYLELGAPKKELQQIWKQFQMYVPNRMPNGWIMYKSQKLICPHKLDILKMEIEGRTDYFINKIIEEYGIGNEIKFCAICGEEIAKQYEDGLVAYEAGMRVNTVSADDEMKEYLFGIINTIVRSYVHFIELYSLNETNRLIKNIIESIYEIISIIENKIYKVKTSSDTDKKNRLDLFIYIYVFAMLSKIIVDNPKKLTFVGVKPQYDALNKFSINLINNLTKVENLDDAFVKLTFTKAYEIISKNIKMKLQSAEEIKQLQFEGTIHQLTTENTSGSKEDTSKHLKLKEDTALNIFINAYQSKLFQTKMSDSILEIKDDAVTTTVINDKNWTDYYKKLEPYVETDRTMYLDMLAKRKPVYQPIIKTRQFVKGEINQALLARQYGYKINEINKKFIESQIQGGVEKTQKNTEELDNTTEKREETIENISKPIENINNTIENISSTIGKDEDPILGIGYKDIQREKEIDLESRGLTAEEKINVQPVQVKEIVEEEPVDILLPHMEPEENEEIEEMKYSKSGHHKLTDRKHKVTNASIIKTSLLSVIHRHLWKWDVYVKLSNFNGSGMSNYKLNDLKIKKENGDIYIDQICGICYSNYYTEDDKISKMLHQAREKESFYNYYENRCPVTNNIHDMKGDKCVECGLTEFNNAYFEKYLDDYKKEIRISIKIPTETPVEKFANKKLESWKYNPGVFDNFLSLGSLTKLNKTQFQNFAQNIGITDNYLWTDIIDGKVHSYKSGVGARPERCDIYVKNIIILYSTLCNNRQLSVIPKLIAESVSVAGAAKLPPLKEFAGNYMKYHAEAQLLFDRKKLAEFSYEYLMDILIRLKSVLDKTVKTLGTTFVRTQLENIILTESEIAKLPQVKRQILEQSKDADASVASDMVGKDTGRNDFSTEDIDYHAEPD